MIDLENAESSYHKHCWYGGRFTWGECARGLLPRTRENLFPNPSTNLGGEGGNVLKLLWKSVVLSCAFLTPALFSHADANASAPSIGPLDGVKVQVNDELVHFPDAQPFVDGNGFTLVPIRFLADKLGYDLKWEMKDSQVSVTLQKDPHTITFKTGDNKALVDGKEYKLDSPAMFSQGRVYVPVRFISDSLGILLQWDNRNRIAILGVDGKYHAPAWYAPAVAKTLDVKATAYSASAQENGGYGAVDYFGNPLQLGTIAVDPSVIPLGSTVYIEGYNFDGLPAGGMLAKATDTGGAIKGNRIDIFVPGSPSKAKQFGLQNVKVHVLNNG